MRSEAAFSGLLVLAFLSLGSIGVMNHEMWRDELVGWLVVRDGSSIGDVLTNLKSSPGHTLAWHLCLYVLSRFTRNPVAMQLWHLTLAAIVIYLLARFSPFTKLQKVLLSFGYFFVYEYAVISRMYVLGVLFLFCFCALYHTRRKGFFLLSVILFLLANTSAYGVIIAVSLGLTVLFECVIDNTRLRSSPSGRWDLAASLLVFALGIVSAALQIVPLRDEGSAMIWTPGIRARWIVETLTVIWRSYIPLPNVFTYQFWNTNILMDGPWKLPAAVCAALSLGLLAFFVVSLAGKPVPLFLYLVGTVAILSFSYIVPYIRLLSGVRHHGHLFVLLVACLWIASHYRAAPVSNRFLQSVSHSSNRYGHKLVMFMLCTHVAAGATAYGADLLNPFSASKDAARFIKDQQMEDMLIVGTQDYAVSPLAALLDREIFYLESGRFGSFIVEDKKRKQKVNPREIPGKVSALLSQRKTDILLVVNYNLAPLFVEEWGSARTHDLNFTIEGLSAFTRSIVPDEQYYLYLIRRNTI